MKEKLLITGASGFLGYHLIEEALSQNYDVYAGVRKSSITSHLLNSSIHLLEINLASVDETKKMIEQQGITHIIHAAGLTRAKTQQDYDFSNAILTRNLADAAMKAQTAIRKFVFISSLASLGPSLNGDSVKESDSPRPVTLYGKSKLLAEQYLNEIPNLPLIGLRPTAVFGPREKDLLLVVKSIVKGIEVYIGGNEQKLSFIYVKDLASIAVKALGSQINNEFYNIADGRVYSRHAFADAVKKATGKKTVRLQLPMALIKTVAAGMDLLYSRSRSAPVLNKDRLNELTAANWSCSIEKSQRDFGFQPMYDLERGMAETVQWYKKNHWIT